MENNQLTRSTFESIKKPFIALLDEETFNKECSFALQHLTKNAYLQKATPQSLLTSVLNIAQVGLTLNPVQKLAYLVPRFINGQVECCLEPSYQGLVKLLTDSGSANNVYAHLVYENDLFEQILGTSNEIIHKPKLGSRGNVVGVYAVAVLANGSKQVEVMDVSEVNEIRDSSESYKAFKSGKAKTAIWETWYDEMARKTVIKRLVKYLPKSNYDKIAKAIDLTNDDFQASFNQLEMIDSLLRSSSIAEERKEFIERNMGTYNIEQASQCISMLQNNQVDAINAGHGYNQTMIKEKLKEV